MYNTMARFGQPQPPLPPNNNGGGFYIKRRMGEVAPRNDRQQPPSNSFRPNNRPLPPALNFEQIRQTSADISETDLYLLSAIEKLVHRVDYLEKRLQTTDKLILHLLNDVRKENLPANAEEPLLKPNRPTTTLAWTTASSPSTATTIAGGTTLASPTASPSTTTGTSLKPKPKPKPTKPAKPAAAAAVAEALCPQRFTAISTVCYHFNRDEHADWKSANGRCRQLGGSLAEFASAREFKAVAEYLAANGTMSTSTSYWLGGLNPGLLWIWSSSAKPVNSAANLAAFGAHSSSSNRNSTTVIPPKAVGAEPKPQKERNVFDIQGNGRCLSLQFNRTLSGFEYLGEDCSRPHGYVCEMRNRRVENEISRVFRALRLE